MTTDRVQVTASPVFVTAKTETMTVRNFGPSTAYYGGASVSSVSNTGSIASGATLTTGSGLYFATAPNAQTLLLVTSGDAVTSLSVTSIVVLTQAAYDALTPDAKTLYVVVG